MRSDLDPTKIRLQTNVKQGVDPTIQRMSGIAFHGNTPFDVPFMSEIAPNLWQGGIDKSLSLELPHFIKHIVSVYPWEAYRIKHNLDSSVSVTMYDSVDQSLDQIDVLAQWVNVCRKTGPVLVHCQAGLNRSSLVVARALMLEKDEPRTAKEAIDLIRKMRSPACLCNRAFEAYLYFIESIEQEKERQK